MGVYVGRVVAGVCRMWGDSVRELNDMADRVGMPRVWLVQGTGPREPHYEVVPYKRRQALKWGAREIHE